MTITTNVPKPTFGPNGFIVPAESAILAGVQADQSAAFGGNLNPGLNTPQGQLASSLAAIIGDANNQFLALTQAVDPAYSSGRMQDAIGRIYFLTRLPATSTTVVCNCNGQVGVVIPVGAQVQDSSGNIYLSTASGTIPTNGVLALPFAAANTGPIACPVGAITTIYQSVPGWDRVTNAVAGTLGSNVETPGAFEQRRQASVMVNSLGSIYSVLAAVLAVPNVADAYATENSTSVSLNVGSVTLIPNSLYVCAYGGATQTIGQAIWSKKSPGCNYTGNTTVTVYDNSPGYVAPYPQYKVSFQTATTTPVMFAVTMQNNPQVPSTAIAQIQAAITAAFTGADGGTRARIGSTLFSTRYYAGIAALGSWSMVYSVQLGLTTANAATVTMGINQVPTITPSNISVTFV